MAKSQKKHHDDGNAAQAAEAVTPQAQATPQPEAPEATDAAQAPSSGAEAPEGTMDTSIEPEQNNLPDPTVLAQDLEKARQKAEENFDGWQRERADFMNYKKRIERDQSQMSTNIKGEVIKKYLVIVDDLDRALKSRPAEGEGAKWAEGIELIYRKLQNILEAEGVSRILAGDEPFDPNRHEAISHEDSPDHKSGEIIEVVQYGYKIGDRILRPALVRVAR
jgi:molecular chaperone GrpE